MLGDLAQVREVPLTPDGKLDVATLNTILRQMQERVFALEGRTQPSQIRDDLEVLGDVSATGSLIAAGGAAEIGAVPLASADPSLVPTIDASLTPQALFWTSNVGAQLDLLSSASPFTWAVKDEFLGGGTTTGVIGDLGWLLPAGTVTVPATSANHIGMVTLSMAGGSTGAMTIDTAIMDNVSYFAAVAQPSNASTGPSRIGLLTSPTAAGEASLGAYFSRLPASSANWRTVTQNGSGATVNTTTIPATVDTWFLLEMVISITPTNTPTVDFYINRQRAFRHQDATVTSGTTVTPTFAVTGPGIGTTSLIVDRFVLSGVPRGRIWT